MTVTLFQETHVRTGSCKSRRILNGLLPKYVLMRIFFPPLSPYDYSASALCDFFFHSLKCTQKHECQWSILKCENDLFVVLTWDTVNSFRNNFDTGTFSENV